MRQWSDATSLDADASPHAELGQELERSRRYERAFSLVRICANGSTTDGGNGSSNGAGSDLTSRLCTGLRSIDRVWTLDGDLVYLLPECDGTQARGFVRRLESTVGVTLSTTVASFPEDGLTGGSLLELLLGEAEALADPSSVATNGHDGTARRRWNGIGRFRFPLPRRRSQVNGEQVNGELEWAEISATPTPTDQPRDREPLSAVDKAAS